ncbi:MAG: LytR/AlgR family response regulator transcription factor [Flavobacteriaceae bacterium]
MDYLEKLKTILVDDEKNNIVIMKHFIKKYCSKIEVVAACTTYDTALKKIKELKPDLVFLDIVLDRDTSFDLLNELGTYDFQIIFTTAFDEYAIKAFKFNAVDYILKPVVIEDLLIAVERVRERIRDNQIVDMKRIRDLARTFRNEHPSNYLIVAGMDRIDFINPRELIYLKSCGRYTEFYTTDKKRPILSSKALGIHEEQLNKLHFYRVHNSYIINLEHLANIDKKGGNYCVMSDKSKMPISGRRYEGLMKFLKTVQTR